MPEPWEKTIKTRDLPNPELNPLHNPTLGKNLGKWAQVYFTTPPEKREQAVSELLRELESGQSTPNQGQQLRHKDEVPPMEDDLFCPACDAPNKARQKFCGACGARLIPVPAESPAAAETHHVLAFGTAEPKAQNAVAPAVTAPATEPADTEWIRERTLTRFTLDEPRGSGWGKYAVLAVVLLLAGFGALEWLSRRPPEVRIVTQPDSKTSAPAAAPLPVNPTPPVQQEAQSQPAAAPVEHDRTNVSEQTTSAENKPSPREPSQAADREPITPADSTLPSSSPAEPIGGTQELALAQHFLGTNGGGRDTTEAAKWLWKSVGKQNVTATVLLADLYWRGDGVPKSCDQARLLLVAAAKKGDSAAGDKLRSLESGGCR